MSSNIATSRLITIIAGDKGFRSLEVRQLFDAIERGLSTIYVVRADAAAIQRVVHSHYPTRLFMGCSPELIEILQGKVDG